MSIFDTYNASRDISDTRDFLAEDLFWAIPQITLPARVILDQTLPLNQWAIGACTVFGSSGALFETISQNLVANSLTYAQPYDPWFVWGEAKKRGASDTQGWAIQSAIQLIKDLKLSAGYVKLGSNKFADVYTLKYWISLGRAITTGTQNGDWGKIVETGIYSTKVTNSGHCFQLNGYDDNYTFPDGSKGGFHCPNSWGGKGSFWMKYSDAKLLYSQYYEIGTEDIANAKILQTAKDALQIAYAEKAKTKGIWNGTNPDAIATEAEISIMAYRTQVGTTKKTRQEWADIIQANILRGKAEFTFWNGQEANRIVTDKELALLITRAVKRDGNISKLSLTRKQIAIVFGRDF